MFENLFFFIKGCIEDVFNSLEVSIKLSTYNEINIEVLQKKDLFKVCKFLKESRNLYFLQLIDLCGVDYLHYKLDDSILDGIVDEQFFFDRFLKKNIDGNFPIARFAVIYHLLSLTLNCRIRVRVFVDNIDPSLCSVSLIWSVAEWYEREVFDLFGIEFLGHKNLCRILTDYGFRDFPLRKDFSLVGRSVVYYSEFENRISYKKNDVELRRLIPKVVRLGSRLNR